MRTMIRTSFGQINADTAKFLYKSAGRTADSLVKLGKITAADRGVAFAKLASSDLAKQGIQVSKSMLATASKGIPAVDAILARSATKSAQVAATAATSGASAMARSAATSATVAVARQSALEAVKGTARGAAPLAAVFFAAEGVYNLARYANGDISGEEAARRTARSAASNSGGVAGAVAGAAIGSVFPFVGTAIGAVVGGLVGGVFSGWAASKAME